jgi:lactoylglutathione lyase
MKLSHTILFVADVDRSVRFYRDVLGLAHRFTDAGYAEFDTGETRFALYEQRHAAWLVGRDVAAGGVSSEVVFLVADVDGEHRRLRALGVPIVAEPTDRPWGHRTLHIADPDGFVVELAQEIPRARERAG